MLARADKRVLLLEGDLRRPHLHKLLGLDPSVGVTTVLAGKLRLAQALQGSGVPGLEVLTSGELPTDPAEVLQSLSMAQLLQHVRDTYDMVVVDAPPLLPVTDAALLAAESDGALVVLRQGKTSREQLRLAVKRLRAVGGTALGVALNMASSRLLGSHYYSYVDDDTSSTLSLLEDVEAPTPVNPAPVNGVRRPGAVIASVRLPEQTEPLGARSNGTAAAGSAAGRPGLQHDSRHQVPEQRPEGVRHQVDRLRGATGQEDRLGDLDQRGAGQPDGHPGQPAPSRPEGRSEKA
jgi:capsular exopolysaccharide synthesis family protein